MMLKTVQSKLRLILDKTKMLPFMVTNATKNVKYAMCCPWHTSKVSHLLTWWFYFIDQCVTESILTHKKNNIK